MRHLDVLKYFVGDALTAAMKHASAPERTAPLADTAWNPETREFVTLPKASPLIPLMLAGLGVGGYLLTRKLRRGSVE